MWYKCGRLHFKAELFWKQTLRLLYSLAKLQIYIYWLVLGCINKLVGCLKLAGVLNNRCFFLGYRGRFCTVQRALTLLTQAPGTHSGICRVSQVSA